MSSSKRMGRPPIENPKKVKLTVRVDEETAEILDAYCAHKGLKRMDGIRAALQNLRRDPGR